MIALLVESLQWGSMCTPVAPHGAPPAAFMFMPYVAGVVGVLWYAIRLRDSSL